MELLREAWRLRCYGCHRPMDRCFCDRIPSIDNRTEVLILQHMRERFHPFNTARILKRSLKNSRLLVDHNDRLAVGLSKMTLSEDVGLLYPGAGSQLLDGLDLAQRPKQLVILDGTWHHTKTLVRDIPQLQSLPRYRLAPSQPSRYTIRREPNVQFLSTLEATVAALQCLEPETAGFEKLVAAFEGMIESQLALPMFGYGWRRNQRRGQTPGSIPKILRDDLENIVTVYGETVPGFKGDRSSIRDAKSDLVRSNTPVYWVAERMVSGERFECAIEPPWRLSATFLQHLKLPESAFEDALSLDAFRQAWEAFLRPRDQLAFYYSNIPKLLSAIGGPSRVKLHLKSIPHDGGRKGRTLEQILVDLNIPLLPVNGTGRARNRLENTIALTAYLHWMASVDVPYRLKALPFGN